MGLPLFIAPVESDIRTKSGASDRIALARSSIRRTRRSEDRGARTWTRRAAILRNTVPSPGLGSSRRSNARPWDTVALGPPPPPPPQPEPARYPWIESGQLPPPEAYQPVLPESALHYRPGRFESSRLNYERIASLSQWDYTSHRGTSPSPPRRPDGRREGPRSRSSQHQAVTEPEDVRSRSYRISNIDPSVAARFDRSPERSARTRRDPDRSTGPPRRRTETTGAGRIGAVDGLGDRNRSVSPESSTVWDTIFTTLTPDPRAPSADSSFASATASASASQGRSQNTATTSRTSFADPSAAEDHPCEIGDLSESDGEMDHEPPAARPERLSRIVPSRHRRFVSALDSNEGSSTSYVRAEIADRPTLHFNGRPDRVSSAGAARDRLQPWGWHSARIRPLPRSGLESPAEGQTTTDALTREGSEDAFENFEQSDVDPPSGSQSTDEPSWAGMQRIVRRLVERRDIPDEWWAEAGLSRTTPDNV